MKTLNLVDPIKKGVYFFLTIYLDVYLHKLGYAAYYF